MGSDVSRNKENGTWHCGFTENNHSNRHPPAEDDEGECCMACRTSMKAFSKCFAKTPLEGRT